MNASDTIFALALASNLQPEQHLRLAVQQLAKLGRMQLSQVYIIPCRDGVGADYYNAACLLYSTATVQMIHSQLQQLEQQAGRTRPSHCISLDVDLIAWGESLSQMQFNPKKCPLPLDVIVPMNELWSHDCFKPVKHQFPVMRLF